MEIFSILDIIEISTYDCFLVNILLNICFQFYGDPELDREPSSGSRQMMNHFGTRFLNEDGSWKNLMNQKIQHLIWHV